jgi:hypothetical protein
MTCARVAAPVGAAVPALWFAAKSDPLQEHAGAEGRLHLNVLWVWQWIDQGDLSIMAGECGFRPICRISGVKRRGHRELSKPVPGSSPAVTYSYKEGSRVRTHARGQGMRFAGTVRRRLEKRRPAEMTGDATRDAGAQAWRLRSRRANASGIPTGSGFPSPL